MVTADGRGVVSHAGSRLLADLADRTTLTGELSDGLSGLRRPRTRHDLGRVLVDLAIAVADGAQTISDIAVLVDQPELFGPVASDSTCWRMLDAIGKPELAAIHRARAAARELAWAQRADITGSAYPPARAADRPLAGLVIDLDATSWCAIRTNNRPRQRLSRPSATTRWSRFWTTPGRHWRGCGEPATPGRIPLPITSACSTLRWPNPRRLPSWDAPAGPRGHRRVHQGFPDPHSPTAHPGDGHRVLRRVGHH